MPRQSIKQFHGLSAGSLLLIALALFGWGKGSHAAQTVGEPSERRPNVLLICVDDLKPIAGCYGGAAKTPHLDRLAARGVLFEKAYCNQAVCAPSRNALLTGLRPQTLGIYDLGTNFRKSRPDAVTLPQHFKQHGWRTEALGKIFHVGHGNHEDPSSWSVPHWRANVVAYALPESRAKKGLTREEALFSNQPAANLPRGAAFEAADVPDSAYPDGAIADEAEKRLAVLKSKPGEPFFLAVGFVKPHLPFCAPKKYWDLYQRDNFALPEPRTPPAGAPRYAPTSWGELRQYRGIPESGPLSDELQQTLIHGYHAAASYMDAQLGRVLAALDSSGLAENTVIVLWGDHGWHLGDHGMWCKHSNYEQAARIPLIVAAPGARAGARSASLVESVDIYPTLCELAGIAAPESLDGASFAATLKQPAATGKNAVFHVYPRGKRIGRAVRTDRHRLVEWKLPGAPAETAELELYDYEADPAETKNLAADHPVLVAQLRALLAKQPEAQPQIVAKNSVASAETRLVALDLTKGPPNDNRMRIEGGQWDNGWRVIGDLDRIVIDLDRDVKNGYFEVVVTRQGEFSFAERKRNWMGLSAVECMHQAPGGYARAGDLMYDFSKAEIFASTQSSTIAEVKFGEPADWVLDDQTVHTVRAEIKEKAMTWTNDKGGKAAAGSAEQPVSYFRFAAVGGILNHKAGWHHGSLVGLRVLRITIVDYDQPAKTPSAK